MPLPTPRRGLHEIAARGNKTLFRPPWWSWHLEFLHKWQIQGTKTKQRDFDCAGPNGFKPFHKIKSCGSLINQKQGIWLPEIYLK